MLVATQIIGTMRLSSMVHIYQCLEETRYLYLQMSLKMEAAGFPETFVNIYQTTGHHIPENKILNCYY
jgi:hypothetical protein